MDIAVMIEGQNDLNWPRWQATARAVEALGFAGLFRSDHITRGRAPSQDSLELWVSLTWLAAETTRIEFGPLVTPASFRDPVFTARMARDVDDLSGGRLTLGLGAGWQEREHAMFGYDLMQVDARFARFEESLKVVSGLLQRDQPFSFVGEYYALHEAEILPHPQRPGGPPILIGGNGRKRTLPLVVRYASEWNAVYVTADRFRALNSELDQLLLSAGRQPNSVRRSLMTEVVFGSTDAMLKERLSGREPAAAKADGAIVGTGAAVHEQLHALAEAGVQRVMLQWLAHDALDELEALAKVVL